MKKLKGFLILALSLIMIVSIKSTSVNAGVAASSGTGGGSGGSGSAGRTPLTWTWATGALTLTDKNKGGHYFYAGDNTATAWLIFTEGNAAGKGDELTTWACWASNRSLAGAETQSWVWRSASTIPAQFITGPTGLSESLYTARNGNFAFYSDNERKWAEAVNIPTETWTWRSQVIGTVNSLYVVYNANTGQYILNRWNTGSQDEMASLYNYPSHTVSYTQTSGEGQTGMSMTTHAYDMDIHLTQIWEQSSLGNVRNISYSYSYTNAA